MGKNVQIIFSVILVIFIVILIFIVKYINESNELNNLNNMYKDIEVLEDHVAMYYLDNGNLPIKDNTIDMRNIVNPNDDLIYNEIDLSLLENLNLVYGNKKFGEDDYYLINNNSHTIYYFRGIRYKNKNYYTKDISYNYIDLENYK